MADSKKDITVHRMASADDYPTYHVVDHLSNNHVIIKKYEKWHANAVQSPAGHRFENWESSPHKTLRDAVADTRAAMIRHRKK